jgi:hypothetical protein
MPNLVAERIRLCIISLSSTKLNTNKSPSKEVKKIVQMSHFFLLILVIKVPTTRKPTN